MMRLFRNKKRLVFSLLPAFFLFLVILYAKRVTFLSRGYEQADLFSPPVNWIASYNINGVYGSWGNYSQYPRLSGDVNGDGRADLVGFGAGDVWVFLSVNDSFAAPVSWLKNFTIQSGGWENFDKFPRILADVNGDGKADLVGFGKADVLVSLSTGSSFTAPVPWLNNFTQIDGWKSYNLNPRFVVDVNNDFKADIVGFGSSDVMVSLSTGSSFSPPVFWLKQLTIWSGGWESFDKLPRVLADVNGDGKADIVGFGNSDVLVALSTGSSFTAPVSWLKDFTFQSGWTSFDLYPRTLADVNGDGKADIVGFGKTGVVSSFSSGSGFAAPVEWNTAFGQNSQLRLSADFQADGCADIADLNENGALVSLSSACQKAASGKKILIISAHQDDEIIGIGGKIIKSVRNRDMVNVVFLTDGDPYPCVNYKAARKNESLNVLSTVGVRAENIRFLDYPPDVIIKKTPTETAALVSEISTLIGQIKPDEIYVHAYEHGHLDHDTVNYLTKRAMTVGGYTMPVYEYLEYHPPVAGENEWQGIPLDKDAIDNALYPLSKLPMTKAELELKRSLISNYKTQSDDSSCSQRSCINPGKCLGLPSAGCSFFPNAEPNCSLRLIAIYYHGEDRIRPLPDYDYTQSPCRPEGSCHYPVNDPRRKFYEIVRQVDQLLFPRATVVPIPTTVAVPDPVNFKASDGTYYDRIKNSWTAATGACGYNLFRKIETGSEYTWCKFSSASAVEWIDYGTSLCGKIVPGAKYLYQIQAIYNCGTTDEAASLGVVDSGFMGIVPTSTPAPAANCVPRCFYGSSQCKSYYVSVGITNPVCKINPACKGVAGDKYASIWRWSYCPSN